MHKVWIIGVSDFATQKYPFQPLPMVMKTYKLQLGLKGRICTFPTKSEKNSKRLHMHYRIHVPSFMLTIRIVSSYKLVLRRYLRLLYICSTVYYRYVYKFLFHSWENGKKLCITGWNRTQDSLHPSRILYHWATLLCWSYFISSNISQPQLKFLPNFMIFH